MPTYVCSLAEGSVNDDQKEAIARALSGIHSEETGAPPYFVQVVIEEKKPTQRFLGGTRVSGQIWIRGDIRAGRTEEETERDDAADDGGGRTYHRVPGSRLSYQVASSPGLGSTWPYSTISVGARLQR